MGTRKPRLLAVSALPLVEAATYATTYAAISLAGPVSLTNVLNANTKSQRFSAASVLSPELQLTAVAQGSTARDGTAPFNANSLSFGVGTPFKRPENGLFQPESKFTAFFFNEIGERTRPARRTTAAVGGSASSS